MADSKALILPNIEKVVLPRAHKKPKSAQKKPSQSVRIIGGKWRSRKLVVREAEGLRPSGDRVRETLFNWLQFDLPGRRAIDMFSGTGSLGLEALSRGVAEVQFCEINTHSAQLLRENLRELDQGQSKSAVHTASSLQWLSENPEERFDLVFIDPPFADELWQNAFESLTAHLNEGGLIHVEAPKDQSLLVPEGWSKVKEKRFGAVNLYLFKWV